MTQSQTRPVARRMRLLATIAATLTASAVLSPQTALASPSNETADAGVNACWFAAYPPNKEPNGTLRAWGEKWDCGDSTGWTIIVQRHRGGAWWQNEATNGGTGNGWLSVTAGCVPGQRTYRTILESNVGHKTVSGHTTITC